MSGSDDVKLCTITQSNEEKSMEMDTTDGVVIDRTRFAYYSPAFLKKVGRALHISFKEVKDIGSSLLIESLVERIHKKDARFEEGEIVYVVDYDVDIRTHVYKHKKTICRFSGGLPTHKEEWVNGVLTSSTCYGWGGRFGYDKLFIGEILVYSAMPQFIGGTFYECYTGFTLPFGSNEHEKGYFLFGEEVSQKEWEEYEKNMKQLTMSTTHLAAVLATLIMEYATF